MFDASIENIIHFVQALNRRWPQPSNSKRMEKCLRSNMMVLDAIDLDLGLSEPFVMALSRSGASYAGASKSYIWDLEVDDLAS